MWMVLLALAGAAIPDTPPPKIELTESESADLAKGKVAVRFTEADQGGGVVGVIDIKAPRDRVWAALLDVKARVDEISGLREANVSLQTETELGVQWVLSVVGTRVQFNVLYDLDAPNGWIRYRLDTSKENDLVDVQGAYQLYDVDGATRIVYRSDTDSGRRVPGFIKRWLASDSLTEQLQGIQKRSEIP